MLKFFLFALAVYGVSNGIAVVKQGRIADLLSRVLPVKFFSDLVHCPVCVSFWLGGAASFLFSPSIDFVNGILWQAALVDAGFASGATYILFVTTEAVAPKDL